MSITLDGTNGITTPDVDTDSIGTDTSTPFAIRTNGTDRVTVTSAGNVGIGTSSPDATLRVAGPVNGLQARFANVAGRGLAISTFNSAGTADNGVIYNAGLFADAQHVWQSGGTERARIDSSGNLLVGTTSWAAGQDSKMLSPIALFSSRALTTVSGHITFNNPNGQVGIITTTGSSTSYSTSSDYRLKENVTPLSDATDRLMQIPVHRFNFIADPDTVVDGFLAHEVQEFVPEAITGTKDEVDDEGNPVYQGIDQSKLVPLLTAALQEALQKIEALEARISALETPA